MIDDWQDGQWICDRTFAIIFQSILLPVMERKLSKNKFKREDFDLRTQLDYQRQYNALKDPHANYYFVSRAAKQRLAHLKSQIKLEKHDRSMEGKQMLKLIKQKIKFQFPKVQLPLLKSDDNRGDRKLSEQKQLKPQSSRLQKINTGANSSRRIQSNLQAQHSKDRGSKMKRKKLKKRKVNHEDFVQFLCRKKQELKAVPQNRKQQT